MSLSKLCFSLDPSDWHGRSQETIWVDVVSVEGGRGILRVQNSPFFAKNVSFLDLVEGNKLEDGVFAFLGVLKRSGHSTYIILCPVEQTAFDALWTPLQDAGCTYESGRIETSMGVMNMFSVDIPPGRDVDRIYSLLQDGENKGVWMFQEAHYSRSGLQ